VSAGAGPDVVLRPRADAGADRERQLRVHHWPVSGEAKAVVATVHGLGDHGRALPYRLFAEALGGGGLAVVTCDLEGHGDVPPRRRGLARWTALLADVDALRAVCRERHPGLPVVLAGLSMGGLLALDSACREPSSLVGVVAVSPPVGPVGASPLAVAAARLLGRALPSLPLAPKLDLAGLTRDGTLAARYRGDPLFHERVTAGLAVDLLDAGARVRTAAPSFPVPVLLFRGKDDRIAIWDGRFAEALPASRRHVVAFDGARHNLFLETNRGEVMERIAAWIGEVSSAPARRLRATSADVPLD